MILCPCFIVVLTQSSTFRSVLSPRCSVLNVGKHQTQSCPPVGLHLIFTMLQRKLKGCICDSAALSVFLLSDNGGEKTFKAQTFICECMRRLPAAEVEKKKVTFICIG